MILDASVVLLPPPSRPQVHHKPILSWKCLDIIKIPPRKKIFALHRGHYSETLDASVVLLPTGHYKPIFEWSPLENVQILIKSARKICVTSRGKLRRHNLTLQLNVINTTKETRVPSSRQMLSAVTTRLILTPRRESYHVKQQPLICLGFRGKIRGLRSRRENPAPTFDPHPSPVTRAKNNVLAEAKATVTRLGWNCHLNGILTPRPSPRYLATPSHPTPHETPADRHASNNPLSFKFQVAARVETLLIPDNSVAGCEVEW